MIHYANTFLNLLSLNQAIFMSIQMPCLQYFFSSLCSVWYSYLPFSEFPRGNAVKVCQSKTTKRKTKICFSFRVQTFFDENGVVVPVLVRWMRLFRRYDETSKNSKTFRKRGDWFFPQQRRLIYRYKFRFDVTDTNTHTHTMLLSSSEWIRISMAVIVRGDTHI